ncbi:hypothetical protein RFI_23325 [Reticulomyxa filosa]|uniref:Uncharacterized protein n=1 Tax=Reticulomyxa filosa TaxID=46433 RepID=X6MKR4_RETFI|nr:hypothetical protein RFI_23325 [Reticulomyxa filosa]|eukprot:ETO14042.1 hypothetical protein RFI_23325 [Reticulomyxa filosa]
MASPDLDLLAFEYRAKEIERSLAALNRTVSQTSTHTHEPVSEDWKETLRAKLLLIKEEAVKDQGTIAYQKKIIDDLMSSLKEAKNSLQQIKKETLVESASTSDDEFRGLIRKYLQNLKAELLQIKQK